MPTVQFDVGSAFTKKRKRMKGTNGTKKVEIKQWNPRYIGEGDTYNAINIYSVMNINYDNPVTLSAWLPQRLHMPDRGTAPYQMIGNSIFLKYLRFKGYIRVYNRNIVGTRWRLRLLRTNNFEFTVSAGGHGQQAIQQYLELHKNNMLPDNWTYPGNVLDACRHNFYKCVKNVDNSNVIQDKVIASGYIPVSNELRQGSNAGNLSGNSAGIITLSHVERNTVMAEGYYNIPLDVKVKCNDFVREGDIRYYYVLETDCGIGFNFTDWSPSSDLAPSLQLAHSSFEVNFFIRGYFTDL